MFVKLVVIIYKKKNYPCAIFKYLALGFGTFCFFFNYGFFGDFWAISIILSKISLTSYILLPESYTFFSGSGEALINWIYIAYYDCDNFYTILSLILVSKFANKYFLVVSKYINNIITFGSKKYNTAFYIITDILLNSVWTILYNFIWIVADLI